jgi:mono/diheme cytochrome c family protein
MQTPCFVTRPVRSLFWLGCVLALAARAESAPIVPGFERFHRRAGDVPALAEGGLLLMRELNCVACHRLPGGSPVEARPRLSLAEVGSRLSPAALATLVADPSSFKPGTLMPRVALAPGQAEALAAYLSTLTAADRPAPVPPGSIASGRALYHTVGCVACHAPEESARPATAAGLVAPPPAAPSVPLELARHYDQASLVRFLVDPLHTRPAGRMPSSHLNAQEAADVAAYLQRAGAPVSRPVTVASSPATIAEGRRLISTLGCLACHTTDAATPVPPATAGPALDAAPVGAERGCLAPSPTGRAPDFRLDADQRRALRTALERLRTDADFLRPEPRLEVARFMAGLNCYACHARDGRGGVEPARAAYFEVTDSGAHSLGDMGNLPPALDHPGRKLTRSWWQKLLWEGGGEVRPYQAARMPAFGRAVSEPVLDAWEKADQRAEPVAIDISGRQLHQRAHYGRALMGTQDGGLGCITCHGLRDRKSIGMPVVPLDHTVERLRPAYFKELLLNPQAVQPGTLMPPMLMGRPKADQEVEQLWTYLREIDQQLLPFGLLQSGEYELRPETGLRPIVFRTFLDGAGLQAVAVGSPSGRHAAFDALDVRWALTWRGRFLDALTTWEERAMTPARPLGEAVTALPGWMPFARTPAPAPADGGPTGAAAGYRYRGFTLGPDGVPTFHYDIETLRVEDTLRPDDRSGGYRRTLVVRGGGAGWYFRGIAPQASPRPVTFDAAGEATLEETWP